MATFGDKVDKVLYTMSLPFRVIVLPFQWLYYCALTVFQASRVVGFLVMGFYLYDILKDIDFAINMVPAWQLQTWLAQDVCLKTAVAVAVYFTLTMLIALSDRRSRPKSVGFQPERVFAHSELVNGTKPRFQADVYGKYEGKWLKSGQAFVTQDCLITAQHVIDPYKLVKLVTEKDEYEFESDAFTNVEGDLAVARITGVVLAKLGLKPGTLIDVEPTSSSGLFVKAHGFCQTSMGLVEPHRAFGFVSYSGSTIGGFSGCPYYCANRIYGMHLGGNAENLGYSSAYISMIIRTLREDTEDFAVEQAAKLGKYQIQQSPWDYNEYRVKIGGRFYNLDAEGVDRLKKTKARATYLDRYATDYDFESCPAPSTPPPKAHEKTVEPEVDSQQLLVDTAVRDSFLGKPASATLAAGPSKETGAVKKRPALKRVGTISSNPQKSSDGLEPTAALREEALAGISKFSKTLRKPLPHLQEALSNKRLRGLDVQSLHTQLTSLRQAIEQSSAAIGSITESILSMGEAPQG